MKLMRGAGVRKGKRRYLLLLTKLSDKQTDEVNNCHHPLPNKDGHTHCWWFSSCDSPLPFFMVRWRCGIPSSLSCRWRSALVVWSLEAFHSPSTLSIILTTAGSFLLAWFSILWQEPFLFLLYGLLLHYCTALVIELTLYSTPGFAPRSNLSFQHKAFSGDNEVCLWSCWCHHISVCPSSPRAQLTGKWIIQHNGKDGCSAVNLKPICSNMTWLLFPARYTAGDDLPASCRNSAFLLCCDLVNYVSPVRRWWSHVARQVHSWLAHGTKIAYQASCRDPYTNC